MSQRLLFPDIDPHELDAGWTPLAEIPRSGGITASDVLDVLAKRHDEGGWNGMPGRWVFLREVQAATGSYGESQRFDGLAVGLVPSNNYARIVYEVKVSRSDWLRELKPKTVLRYRGNPAPHATATYRGEDAERMADLGYSIEEQVKWGAAMAIATEFWYAAPVRCILADELPEGAGLLEVRPWGPSRELRARAVVQAKPLGTPSPGPEFWAAVLRRLAGRSSARG